MVKKDDEDDSTIRLYRGTNMEVSMPTGSLCAERNVIGTALAADLTLRRQDLKYIAVYSACLDPLPNETTSPNASLLNTPMQSNNTVFGNHLNEIERTLVSRSSSLVSTDGGISISSDSNSRANSYSESHLVNQDEQLIDGTLNLALSTPIDKNNNDSKTPERTKSFKLNRQNSRKLSNHGMSTTNNDNSQISQKSLSLNLDNNQKNTTITGFKRQKSVERVFYMPKIGSQNSLNSITEENNTTNTSDNLNNTNYYAEYCNNCNTNNPFHTAESKTFYVSEK